MSRGKDYEHISSDMDGRGVKLSRRTSDGRIVAVKHAPKEAEEVYRLLMENHYAGIPEVLDIRNEGAFLTVTEEYVEGRDLRSILDEGRCFSEKDALSVISSLISILRPLHFHHPAVIHRDIKPENIILDNKGMVWLIDWGAAKKESGNRSRDTILMGTEGYAAPEQYGFSQSDPSTDIYAIGVLLNELLTGELPSGRKCRGRLRPVVDKCTELDKANRFKSVDELRKAITFRKPGKWLPPGFRGSGIIMKLVSAFLYYILIYGTMTMDIKDSKGPADTILNRVFAFILFLSIVLFFGNWAGMWSRLPLMRSESKVKRITGLLLWPLVIAALVMTVFSLCEMLI